MRRALSPCLSSYLVSGTCLPRNVLAVLSRCFEREILLFLRNEAELVLFLSPLAESAHKVHLVGLCLALDFVKVVEVICFALVELLVQLEQVVSENDVIDCSGDDLIEVH